MFELENLKDLADRNLGGLHADTRLFHQIQNQAKAPIKQQKKSWRPAVAMVMVAALLCVGILTTQVLDRGRGDIDVVSHSAGGELPTEAPSQDSASIEQGSVQISEATAEIPVYRNLFAAENSGNFPLIKIGNETYRMLTNPTLVSQELLGESLGTVMEYTMEPSIGTAEIISNIVSTNQTVYAIQGMQGAMVAASVQGSYRAFQRVSYAGIAITDNEQLQDVLLGDAQVTAMELSDVGIISDPDEVQTLVSTLLDNASYATASVSANTNQSLLLKLDNGLIVQLNVKDGAVSACGTWSCPEFFDAFAQASQN